MFLASIVHKIWPPGRQNEGPSKSWVWRSVAGEFLGQSLSPSRSTAPGAPPAYGFDVEWKDLYNILQDYILRGVSILPNEFFLLFTYLLGDGLGSILFILENCFEWPLVDHGSFRFPHPLHRSNNFHS